MDHDALAQAYPQFSPLSRDEMNLRSTDSVLLLMLDKAGFLVRFTCFGILKNGQTPLE